MLLAFDLLHQDRVDLRSLPLSERNRDLDRLCRHLQTPFLKQIETFPDGEALFDHCNQFGFEGVVPSAVIGLYERPEPTLGQGQVPGLETRQRGPGQVV